MGKADTIPRKIWIGPLDIPQGQIHGTSYAGLFLSFKTIWQYSSHRTVPRREGRGKGVSTPFIVSLESLCRVTDRIHWDRDNIEWQSLAGMYSDILGHQYYSIPNYRDGYKSLWSIYNVLK